MLLLGLVHWARGPSGTAVFINFCLISSKRHRVYESFSAEAFAWGSINIYCEHFIICIVYYQLLTLHLKPQSSHLWLNTRIDATNLQVTWSVTHVAINCKFKPDYSVEKSEIKFWLCNSYRYLYYCTSKNDVGLLNN